MRTEFKELMQRQLDHSLDSFNSAKHVARPSKGWLNAVRQSLGLSAKDVADKLGVDRQRILIFENAEAEDRITLASLRRVARALDCELVYAIVPKSGSLTNLAEQSARARATEDVRAVERTMTLENQGVGNVEDLIEKETKRRRKQ